MRILGICLACLFLSFPTAAQAPDDEAEKELELVLKKAAPPKEADEAERKKSAEEFKASLAAYLATWTPRAKELTRGRYALGRACLLSGRAAEAIPHLEVYVEKVPDGAEIENATLSLGSAYLDAEKPAAARAVFEKFLTVRPNADQRVAARFYLGVAKLEEGESDGGLAALEEVLKTGGTNPLVADAQIMIVRTLLDLGRHADARAKIETLLKDHPDAAALTVMKEQADRAGQPAPEWSGIRTWIGGDAKSLGARRGRVVVVCFFADFYETCQAEIDRLKELSAKFAGKPVDFVGLTTYYRRKTLKADEEDEHVRAFVTARKLPFTVGVAADFTLLKSYSVRGIPHTVVIDGQGRVIHEKVGAGRRERRSAAALESAITRAL